MSRRAHDALQACLEALEEGRDPEEVLAAYPDLEPELRPLLVLSRLAAGLGDDEPERDLFHRSRARILGRAHELRQRSLSQGRLSWLPRLAVAAALALTIFLSGSGLYLASAQALPGDALYPVKRAAEGLRLNIASNPQNKLRLSLEYSERRLDEVQALLQAARRSSVSFTGVLQARGGARLDVEGVPVLIVNSTQVDAALEAGQVLQIEGVTQPTGFVLAERIEPGGYVLTGTLRQLEPDAALVDDTTVQIVAGSELDADLSVGDRVKATVRLERGYAIALRIERLGPSTPPTAPPPASERAPQPSATPTGTAEPTETEELRFEGLIEQQFPQRWRIAGRWVSINADTEIEGNPIVGDRVEVRAIAAADGNWIAERIRLLEVESEDLPSQDPEQEIDDEEEQEGEEVRLEGEVESIQSGQWTVAGKLIYVDGNTRIEGQPKVGDSVEVRAMTRSDGTLYAERIERED